MCPNRDFFMFLIVGLVIGSPSEQKYEYFVKNSCFGLKNDRIGSGWFLFCLKSGLFDVQVEGFAESSQVGILFGQEFQFVVGFDRFVE